MDDSGPRVFAVATNVALFQAGWFACALGAAHDRPWLGVLAAAAIVGWHLWRAPHPARECVLVVGTAAFGALFDTLLVRAGLVRFATGVLVDDFVPYWMVALWAIFATTLNVSLRTIRARPGLSALLGAIGGPAAYYAGARLGALELAPGDAALAAPGAASAATALVAIGAGWAIVAPALLGTARRLDGYANR
jgi:hypothetical protein